MAARDIYNSDLGDAALKPASIFETVTPSDSADLAYVSRGLYIGVAGDVKVNDVRGASFLFKNAIAGSVIPIRVARVLSTGTTATNIIALT